MVDQGDDARARVLASILNEYDELDPLTEMYHQQTFARFLLQHGSEKWIEPTIAILEKNGGPYLEANVPLVHLALHTVGEYSAGPPRHVRERAKRFWQHAFEGTGLDVRETLQLWMKDNAFSNASARDSIRRHQLGQNLTSDVMKRGGGALGSNFQRLREIKKDLGPAAPGILYHKCGGIIEFGRYPMNLLKAIYEHRESAKPFDLMVGARHDDNQAFRSPHYTRILESFTDQVHKAGLTMRIIEIEDGRDGARRLLDLKKRYLEKTGKIKFGIGAGHGQVDQLKTGSAFAFHQSQLREGAGTRRVLSELFEDQAPWILVSCSTGAEQGLAYELSKATSGRILAPEIPTHVYDMQFAREGEKTVLNVVYRDTESKVFLDGERRDS